MTQLAARHKIPEDAKEKSLLGFPTPPAPHSADFPPFADLHEQTVPGEGLALQGAFQEH